MEMMVFDQYSQCSRGRITVGRPFTHKKSESTHIFSTPSVKNSQKDAHFVTPESPPLEILKDATVFRPERNQFVRRAEDGSKREWSGRFIESIFCDLRSPEEVKACGY